MLPKNSSTPISHKGEMNIPEGFCQCGCGIPTTRITYTIASRGYFKGKYNRFAPGHRDIGPLYIVDPKTNCHVWQRNKTKTGYGLMGCTNEAGNPTSTTAHRYFYEQKFGPLPKDVELDHICRNRACVNLEHLERVSHTENVRRSSITKLSEQDAYDIKLLYKTRKFTQEELAVMYDTTRGAVCSIVLGATWKDVGE